jgi:hypothetical protein
LAFNGPFVKVDGSDVEKGQRHVRSATALSGASSPLFQVSAGSMVRKKFESDEERWRDVGIGRLLCQLNAHKVIARALQC